MKKWHSFIILLLLPVFITSCSKKDNPVSTNNQDAVSLPGFSFKGPNTRSNDQYAAQTKTQISSANNYAQIISSAFVHISPTKNGNTWSWVWQAGGGATETLTGLKNNDGSVSWELILNGNIYGHNYSNRKIMDGTTSADEKKGSWNVYDENTTILVNRLSWTTDEAGVVSGTLTNYSYSIETGKKEIVNRPDKSGELRVYDENNVITFQSIWKTDGSGDWTSYTNGLETSSGSWQ